MGISDFKYLLFKKITLLFEFFFGFDAICKNKVQNFFGVNGSYFKGNEFLADFSW